MVSHAGISINDMCPSGTLHYITNINNEPSRVYTTFLELSMI